MVVLLSKLGTPETVGRFALASTVTTPVIKLASLELRAVQATDARQVYSFGHYTALRLITSALSLPVAAAITIASGYHLETALVILAMGLVKAFEAVGDGIQGLLQQHERLDRVAKALMLRGVVSLSALAAGLLLTNRLLWAMLGLAFVSGLLIAYDMRSALMLLRPAAPPVRSLGVTALANSLLPLRPRWESRSLWRLARTAAPLGVVSMLVSLNTYIPRYILERKLGERELGLFAALSYLIVVGNTVVSALSQSASPRLAKHYAAREMGAFRTLLLRLVAIGALLGLAAILAAAVGGARALSLLYSPEYAARVDVLRWLMVAAAASYVAAFLRCGVTAAHYYSIQPVYLAASAAISGVLCLYLVPRHGLVGAAWALLASYCAAGIAAALCNQHAMWSQRGAARSATVTSQRLLDGREASLEGRD